MIVPFISILVFLIVLFLLDNGAIITYMLKTMKIDEVIKILQAKVVTSNNDDEMEQEISKVFASDLMSDVLTVETDGILLLTGLNNVQTIRTAEVADINIVVITRGKKIAREMIQLAEDSGIVLLECEYSLFRASGVLFKEGLLPVF